MQRVVVFLYGIISYLVFLVAFLYAIGFVGNLLVPKSIDMGEIAPLSTTLLINLGLLALFAIQHTIMARPKFKEAWTKIIPEAAERSTFVLVTSLILLFMYWKWVPMPEIVWNLAGTTSGMVLTVLFWIGWGLVFISTFMVDHFELFGLAQITRFLQKKEFALPPFTDKGLYKFVRHPIMLGFLIAFWATPVMTYGHLLFSVMTTGYIFIGVLVFEEKDLKKHFGNTYIDYTKRVPSIIPFTKFGKK